MNLLDQPIPFINISRWVFYRRIIYVYMYIILVRILSYKENTALFLERCMPCEFGIQNELFEPGF